MNGKSNSFRIGQQKIIHTYRGVKNDQNGKAKYVVGDCGINVKLDKAFPETIAMRIDGEKIITQVPQKMILCPKCHKIAMMRLKQSMLYKPPQVKHVQTESIPKEIEKLKFAMTTNPQTITQHIYDDRNDVDKINSLCNCSIEYKHKLDIHKTFDEIKEIGLSSKICKTCMNMAKDAAKQYEINQK